MSTTLKLNGGFVTDPKNINWDALHSLMTGSFGAPVLSRMRSAILEFPPLTPSQYYDWFSLCDMGTDYTSPGYLTPNNPTVYLPRRTDAAYTLNPDGGSITPRDPSYIALTVYYNLHFKGGSMGSAGLVYNTRIEVYSYIQIATVPP